jgi:uncharacterized membrane protein
VSRYDWLLFLHVLSAFALVAAVVVYSFFIAGSRNLSVPSDVLRVLRVSRLAAVLSGVGSVGVLVFGIWLAIDLDQYQLWDGWIIAALVLWLVQGAVGNRSEKTYNVARDRARALVAEGRDGPSSELKALVRTPSGLAFHLASVGVVLLLLVDMIFKPGA